MARCILSSFFFMMVKAIFNSKKIYYFLPSLLFLLILGTELLLILAKNKGVFTYTLDDPYIHLSLAKRIVMGVYGLNEGEYSSPDSSILWPFLLAPFSWLSCFSFIPLLINTVCSLGILWVFAFLVQSTEKNETVDGKKLFLLVLLIPALNLVGLALMGMEHSLQMLLTVLLVLGLIAETRTNEFPRWLGMVIILGPLVRYENLALSIPALVFLFYRGHHKKAVYVFLILSILLASFTLFLIHIGQPFLPASVLNKTSSIYKTSVLSFLMMQLLDNIKNNQALVFLVYVCVCLVIIYFTHIKRIQKQLIIILLTSIGLHLLWGKFGWFERYELYLHAAFWLLMVYLYCLLPLKKQSNFYYLAFCGLLILASLPYFRTLSLIYWASNNVYLQQFQMRQFVFNRIKAPVAANDIGLLSFNNSNYVLDLWGLGNYSVYKKQILEKNPQWMDDLAQKYHIQLAMVYKNYFPHIPSSWRLIGCLSSSGKRVIMPSLLVYFYATQPNYYSQLKEEMMLFSKELPKGDVFLFDCPQ